MATMTIARPPKVAVAPDRTQWASGAETNSLSYPEDVEVIRKREYPTIKDMTYLDHAGTTLYAKSMIESFTGDLTSNVFGNPHSASMTSQLSSRRIDDIRLQTLQFFGANPDDFDVVFVANATAAIKLVADAFRDHEAGFLYRYHNDAHTSLVGVREVAELGSDCFADDSAVDNWLDDISRTGQAPSQLTLFAYPGQSNMTGRRLPYQWSGRIQHVRRSAGSPVYSLFDAAALVSTSPLDLSNPDNAPDFTAVSFYKIFGFPDLGALIVRKQSSEVLRARKYFAGGTVDMVSGCDTVKWHMKKEFIHNALEDGTLPFHNIIALEHAMKTHRCLYGSLQNIANHTGALRANLHHRMKRLKHSNGSPVCKIYGSETTPASEYGPVIAFNLFDSLGNVVSNAEIEKMAIVKSIQVRTGGLCNPGGVVKYLELTSEEMKQNYAAGQRCGGENDIFNRKPTGVVRVSFGAMSSSSDVDKFMEFLEEFYVTQQALHESMSLPQDYGKPHFVVESMSVFPIKSCSAFKIPRDTPWEITPKGLAWDREWCLVHQGTNVALSQKQHPRMALLQPSIDIDHRSMTISFADDDNMKDVKISLDDFPVALGSITACQKYKPGQSLVCGESVPVRIYAQPEVSAFFSNALGVPCALARYSDPDVNGRRAKLRRPKSKSSTLAESSVLLPSIKLSNESPILMVSRSSVNRLNEQIRRNRSVSQEILPESFRANIVISEIRLEKDAESPYIEDSWHNVSIGRNGSTAAFEVMGPCQRCQMVCVDQSNAKRRPEPFSTLAKTRRWDGGVWFGIHLCLDSGKKFQSIKLRTGDSVLPS